jgi:hypothetical protein
MSAVLDRAKAMRAKASDRRAQQQAAMVARPPSQRTPASG